MKHFARVLFALVVLLALACTAQQRVVPPSKCVNTVQLMFHADTDFTPTERVAIRQAMQEWRQFSGGRVDADVLFDVDFSSTGSIVSHAFDSEIIRAESWMQVVINADAMQTARTGRPFIHAGWTEDNPKRIFLVIDRIPAEDLHLVLAHELGHAAGLHWQGCEGLKSECVHTSVPGSLMFSGYGQSFTPDDLAFCRASCLCP